MKYEEIRDLVNEHEEITSILKYVEENSKSWKLARYKIETVDSPSYGGYCTFSDAVSATIIKALKARLEEIQKLTESLVSSKEE